MKLQFICQVGTVFLLMSSSVMAQDKNPLEHPQAKKALEKVLLEKDFGQFKFEKGNIVTMKQNDRVPGLNGLMFTYYKSAEGQRIMLSIQWFQDKKDLLAFYDSQLKHLVEQQKLIEQQMGLKKRKIEGSVIWSIDDKAYYWTDSSHFVVSMGGAPIPTEMAKAYLELIPSMIAEIGKE